VVTGASVDWLASIVGAPGHPERVFELAASVADAAGVYVVAALAGLGAPHWDPAARGLICGATRGTTAAHLARATVGGIAYQVRDESEWRGSMSCGCSRGCRACTTRPG
jgi:glycerol kinase